MRRLARALAAALLLGLLAAGPARPQGTVERLTEEASRFTASAMVFVFFHELGHALIDLLDLPTVGKEEDVVDEFATWVFLRGAKEAGGQDADEAIKALLLAAESWRLLWKGTEAKLARGGKLPWWDEHSLDIQRYYNIVCLIYGSDPGRFWPLVVRAQMPVERARKCEREWPQKDQAWERLLAGKYVPEGQPRPAGAFGRFRFLYGEVGSEFGRQMEADFKATGAFQELVEELNEVVLLPPGEIPVIAKDCGFANAFWSGDERRMVLCWEMFRFFLDAWVEEAKTHGQAPPQGGDQPPGGDQPGGGRPGPPPAAGVAPSGMGPLGPLLEPGRAGPWMRTVEGGRFALENSAEPDNLWRVFVAGEPPAGRRRIAVTVAAEGRQPGRGGGLAYGLVEGEGRAFYLLLDPAGQLSLRAEVEENGKLALRPLKAWPEAARPGAPTRLELVETGRELAILVDGRPLGRLVDPGFGSGSVGIAAWGTGRFVFERFELAAAPEPGPQLPVAQPQPPQQQPQPPQQQPQPIPPPPAPALDPQLLGSWTAWPTDPQGRRTALQLQLLPDGRYLESRWPAQAPPVRIWGQWRAQGGRLELWPQGSDPHQLCGPQGCQPMPVQPPQTLAYQLIAGSSLQLGTTLYYRGP